MTTCTEKIQAFVRLLVAAHWKKYCELRRKEMDRYADDDGMCQECGDAGDCPTCYGKVKHYD